MVPLIKNIMITVLESQLAIKRQGRNAVTGFSSAIQIQLEAEIKEIEHQLKQLKL